jgi:transcription elongation GreA/GreB family factor
MSKIDELREELIKLQKEREKIILEKGLEAEENGDLRENATFNNLEIQEWVLTSKIRRLIQEITDLAKKKPTL